MMTIYSNAIFKQFYKDVNVMYIFKLCISFHDVFCVYDNFYECNSEYLKSIAF